MNGRQGAHVEERRRQVDTVCCYHGHDQGTDWWLEERENDLLDTLALQFVRNILRVIVRIRKTPQCRANNTMKALIVRANEQTNR